MTTAPSPAPAAIADSAAASPAPSLPQQIRTYLDEVLAADTSEPAAAHLQVDRARMLRAVHGPDLVAAVYAQWLRDHQDAAMATTPPLTSWDEVTLACAPIPHWTRDHYGFLCVCCGENEPQVRNDADGDDLCRPCARRVLELPPGQVRRLNRPAAHGHLVFSGIMPAERWLQPDIEVPLTDGTSASYAPGDALAFATTWKGMTLGGDMLTGEVARPRLQLSARTSDPGHAVEIVATFDYDPTPHNVHPYSFDRRPYGFRLVHATLTNCRGTATTHADLHELLDAITRGEPHPGLEPGAPATTTSAITNSKENTTVLDPHTTLPPEPAEQAAAVPSEPVALTELTRLAVQLGRRTGLRSIMLAIQPPQPDLAARPAAVDVVDCQPAPVLRLQEDLLYADPGSTAGQAAAGALAHQLACRATSVPRAAIGAKYTLASLYPAVVVAAALAWPAWMFVVMFAIATYAITLRALAMHVREFAVDDQAAGWLSEHGLDGDACIRVMLGQIAAAETRIGRIRAWVEAGRPTATSRARALAHARRRADELQ